MKKENTRDILVDSFKKLVMTMPFTKITVKEITEEAGLKRGTFYNYFKDKYDLLSWIFYNDIISSSYPLIENKMFKEANYLILVRLEQEKAIYCKFAKVNGQNSFKEIIIEEYKKILNKFFSDKLEKIYKDNYFITPNNLSHFYANSSAYIILKWIEDGMKIPASEIEKIFEFMVSNSLIDILSTDKKISVLTKK